MNNKVKKVALIGYYGNSNAGDEALLKSVVSHFKNNSLGETELLVLSSNPEKTQKAHGIRSIHNVIPSSLGKLFVGLMGKNRFNFIKSNIEAFSCDALVLGGGGLFFDRKESCKDFLSFINTVRLYQFLGKEVYFLGVSASPFYHKKSKYAFNKVVTDSRLKLVVCRDEVSSDLFIEAGMCREKLHVTEDIVFTLSMDKKDAISENKNYSTVAFSLCGDELLANLKYAEVITEVITRLINKGVHIHLIALSTANGRDSTGMRETLKEVMTSPFVSFIDSELSVTGYLDFFSKVECVIAERLHASILSAVVGTPIVGISYKPKVSLLYDRLKRQDYCMENNEVTTKWLYEKIDFILSNNNHEKNEINKKFTELSLEAKRTFDLFESVFR